MLLGLSAFGLFGVTAGPLTGYEPETAAVSEGLVRTGQLQVLPETPFGTRWIFGRGGHYYSRTGLIEPLLEAPVYWLGEQLDQASSEGTSFRWRLTLLDLFNPAMAALTVVAIFALLSLRGVTERRALLISALCAVGTLIWPYSKFGMETTLMAMLALTVLAAAWTARGATAVRLALLGCAVASTVNSKPYGAVLVVGVIPLLGPALTQLRHERRFWPLAALAVPVIVGLAAAGWYNWYRTGSVWNFDDTATAGRLLATPFTLAGLLVSPGKGLVLYSPLVVLGILGLRDLWRADRPLASAIVLTASLNIVFIATLSSWADETWGPRYIVPSVWLLVLPIAWWTTTRCRRRWLSVVAVIGVCVQFVGILGPYVSVAAARTLAGGPVYQFDPGARGAYGDDGPRWVPQASPLLFRFQLIAAYFTEKLTGTGFTVTYEPYRGNAGILNLRHPEHNFGPLPDFWWTAAGETTKQDVLVALLAILCLGSGTTLARRTLPTARDTAPAPA